MTPRETLGAPNQTNGVCACRLPRSVVTGGLSPQASEMGLVKGASVVRPCPFLMHGCNVAASAVTEAIP